MSDASTVSNAGPAGPVEFARRTGSPIAAKDAAPWVTDFLNAAYYRRPMEDRDVEDLRMAFAILTTYWYRKGPGARLRVTDLPPFHRAFGGNRLSRLGSSRGVLSHEELRDGGAWLIGDWFPEAYADDQRRGWG